MSGSKNYKFKRHTYKHGRKNIDPMNYYAGFRFEFPVPDEITCEEMEKVEGEPAEILECLNVSLKLSDYRSVYYFLVLCFRVIPGSIERLLSQTCEFIHEAAKYLIPEREYVCKTLIFLFHSARFDAGRREVYDTLSYLAHCCPNSIFGYLILDLASSENLPPKFEQAWNNKLRDENAALVISYYSFHPRHWSLVHDSENFIFQQRTNRHNYILINVDAIIEGAEKAAAIGYLPEYFPRSIVKYFSHVRPRSVGEHEFMSICKEMRQTVYIQRQHSILFEATLIFGALGLPLYCVMWIMDYLIPDSNIPQIVKYRKMEKIYLALRARSAVNYNNLQLIPYVDPAHFLLSFSPAAHRLRKHIRNLRLQRSMNSDNWFYVQEPNLAPIWGFPTPENKQ